MKKDWRKERAKGAKHARMMRKKPELREALYGRPLAENHKAATRETAHKEGQNDG